MSDHIPRVSDILHPYSSLALSKIPKPILENAANRGTRAHQFAISHARGDFVPPLSEEDQKYFDSFREWYDANVHDLLLSEKRMVHKGLFYSGHPDLVVTLKGSSTKCLIDIKTSSKVYQTHPVQLAAYLDLCSTHGCVCDKAIILKLDRNGGPAEVHDFGDCNPYFKLFLKALDLYNYFIRQEATHG